MMKVECVALEAELAHCRHCKRELVKVFYAMDAQRLREGIIRAVPNLEFRVASNDRYEGILQFDDVADFNGCFLIIESEIPS
jgi:hypothetical protein